MPSSDRYATLQKIKRPTLVVHGTKDIVVPPINAFILAEHLPDAQLIMYPDSNHGAQYQHAELFLKHAKLFLDELKTRRPSSAGLIVATSRVSDSKQESRGKLLAAPRC